MSQKKLRQIRKQIIVDYKIDDIAELPSVRQILKKNWKFLIILSLAIFLLFFNSLNGGFVSDDYASITQETKINDFEYMFKSGLFGNSQSLTTYFVNQIFGNTNPLPYHLTSLLYFIILNIIAYILVILVTKNELIARMTMLLYAFHPIHVEAVVWISGRNYIILAIYICLSLVNFIYYLNTAKYKYLFFSSLFFLLGFLTDRPRPFAVFLLIFLYILFIGWKKVKNNLSKIIVPVALALVGFIIVALPYIYARISVVNSGINTSDSIFYNPLFQYPTAISKYLQLLYFPTDLTLYHTMYILPTWLNWVILINYLALVIFFYFKDKRYFWALTFIFVAIAPSMAPIKVSWLVAERYMLLGSLGFCWLLGLLLSDYWLKFKYIVLVFFVLIMSSYGVRTFNRNSNWQTNHDLWVDTCKVSPNSHNAWNNIGDDYDKLTQYDNAIKGFTQSTIVKPNYADAFHNRANIFYKIGRLDLARDSYDTAISFSPGLYQTYLSLVQIDLTERKLDFALIHAKKALELQPNNPQAAYVLGIVYAESGKIDEAKKIMTTVTQNYPGFQLASEALKKINEIKK